ncbi:SDR family oxidoreductase [Ktedonosporobacter rubrisoli]|uniref:SDR family oxidoreductase n=1 Tax=Ktedonosporobacter rubrisoli TaxID=2509675 RepID=A0A4P6JLU8_KTERU|nr:SDR family oxidoreductase [Ktedonosporobacter rubrisoli]QBD75972.1 SDR family oxidoreductase [Ktedonosporobacter rubrisoli]
MKEVHAASISSSTLLQGQVALITGASRGIGAATALLLARHGAAIGVNYYQNAQRAQAVVETIRASGGRAIAMRASVENVHEVEVMVQQVEQELGPIDTLVLNAIAASQPVRGGAQAGGNWSSRQFLNSTWEQYQEIVMRLLVGAYVPARVIAPLMVERKHGNIIAVSSTLARVPYSGAGALAAGKAGVEALLKALVPELGPQGIRVNVVAPGAVETEASAPYIQAHKEAISQALPLRRVGQPEDIAATILLLALPQASYLTGNYLAVGGGNYLP